MTLLYSLNNRALDTVVEERHPTAAVVAMNFLLKLMNAVAVCLKAHPESADPRDLESKPPFLISDSVLWSCCHCETPVPFLICFAGRG